MADAVPVIDLDVPSRAEADPGSRPAVPRGVLGLGVLIAVLCTLAASAPPARTMLPVLAAGGTVFTLGPEALFTAVLSAGPDARSEVRRYALPGGELSWAATLPQNVQHLALDRNILYTRSGSDPLTYFLDAVDGRVLWRLESRSASVVTLAGGRVLLRSDTADGRTQLRLADARTGATIWSRLLDGVGEIQNDDLFEDDPDRIVVIGFDGHVTTLQFADGTVLGEGELGVRLPVELDANLPAGFVGVTVSGDQLYLSRRNGGRTSLTAYRLPELTPRWRTDGGPAGFVRDCGPVLCISDARWVSGLDPSNGAVRWSDPAWSHAGPLGDGTLLAADQQETPEAAILDARTGVVLRELGRTQLIGGLELRSDTKIPEQTWVAVAGPGDSLVRTVGSVRTVAPYRCMVQRPYLACPTPAGPTTVWRIP